MNTPPTSIQHRRSFTPAAGVTARVRMRIRLDHVANGEGKFGFYSENSDPFVGGSGSEPDYGAYFYHKQGSIDGNGCNVADIWARVNNNSSGAPSEHKLFQYMEDTPGPTCEPDGDVWDLVVEVNGTSNVKFYWKLSTDLTFGAPHTFTTNIPTMAMQFSAANRCITGSNGFIQFRMFEWEVIED